MADEDWWGHLVCWNGLSEEQQLFLVRDGVLPYGRWTPEGGTCERGAEIEITTMYDKAPGPRFYCRLCAIKFLEGLTLTHEARTARARARGVRS